MTEQLNWTEPTCGQRNTQLQPTPASYTGKGKYPYLNLSSQLVPIKAVKKSLRDALNITAQRHRLTKRLRPNHERRECLPSHTLLTKTSLMTCLPQFLLPHTSCSVSKQKLQGKLKGKKTVCKQSEHQSQTQICQACWNLQMEDIKLWLAC